MVLIERLFLGSWSSDRGSGGILPSVSHTAVVHTLDKVPPVCIACVCSHLRIVKYKVYLVDMFIKPSCEFIIIGIS